MNRTLLLVALLMTGCGTDPAPAPPTQTPARSAKPTDAEKPSHATQPGSSSVEDSEVPDKPDDFAVDKLQTAYESNPSEENKVAYVKMLVANADHYMYKSELPPNQKYPKALALYRRAQKLEPENARVKESIETIESIYRSIGKDIPPESA